MASISFFGGVGTVTGSKYLIESGKTKVLVDCGLFQGVKELRNRNWQELPFDPSSLTSVLLTHAHIDHSGYLPRLVKEGYKGPIYCSSGTADILRVVLPDAGRLQEEEADYRNRHNLTRHETAKPLFDEQDAYIALKQIEVLRGEGVPRNIAPGINVNLYNAGHILGSRFALVEVEGAGNDHSGRTILFSGDIGQLDTPILKDPSAPPICDYLLVESTYGDRLHAAVDPKEQLASVIHKAIERGGPILIPAFAVGRTQDLIYILRELENEKRIPILPVRVDSPMAAAATTAYRQHREEHDKETEALVERHIQPLATHNMAITATREKSKHLNNETGVRILISASGMMTGGRVLHHAQRILPDPKATIVFCGYQSVGTTGRRILDGEKVVRLMRQDTPVLCHVESIEGFSAHADWQGVLRWLEGMPGSPREVFITHGEGDAAISMAQHITDKFHWNTSIPKYADKFEIE